MRRTWLIVAHLLLAVCLGVAARPDHERKADAAKEQDVRTPAASLAPRTVTLHGDKILLSQALKEIEDQTKIAVASGMRTDPALKLDLKNVPFWQALDTVARQANAQVSLHGRLSLVDRAGDVPQPPTSYSGPFRTTIKRIVSRQDFETGTNPYTADLEIAWEPGFRAFYVEKRPKSLFVEDGEKSLPVPGEGSSQQYSVGPSTSAEVDLRLPSLPRSLAKIPVLKGSLFVIGASRMLPFRFEKLQDKDAPRELTREGVKVELRKVSLQGDPWVVQVELHYPPGGPKFDTYQSWLTHNELVLQSEDGKRRLRPSGNPVVGRLSDNFASVTYYFADKKERGKPETWKVLEYHTPARILETEVPFVFKDVPLP